MNAFPSARPRSKLPLLIVLLVIVVAAAVVGGYVLWPRFESEPPRIAVTPNVDVLGVGPIEIQITDQGAGLKSFKATLTQGGTERSLASEQFDRPIGEKKIVVALAKVSGVKEGPAVLRVTARDGSLSHFFSGNEAALEKNVTIDITPPTLELIADDRYVNFGGVGAIVYKPAADTAASGVKIGDYLFRGFPGQVKDHPDHWLALFAHPYDVPAETRPTLVATDKAGNTREMRLAYELKNVRYKKSTIAVSDNFLQNKVAPLLTDAAARSGAPKDVFVAVNKRLRRENEERIITITKQATPSMLWKDAFAQLSNSKVEANFADQRTYTYNGEAIDTAYHLGYDLSVTKNYPAEAANSGAVAFTGDLGIYGNTVILDHGLGLFTLYSHLNSIDVKVGDSVAKRQILGKTGETGLAAGDHLHFGVYLDGVAVLPVEWWDQKWIDDNIKPKLEGRSGLEIAEAQQAVKSTKKGGGKKRR
ncbi:MAG TPA: M23 family metallopeptidase [Burkholderiaceae bacterium]|nr:M23 family metallopeptidase [Burkholderiaceae bacterium]